MIVIIENNKNDTNINEHVFYHNNISKPKYGAEHITVSFLHS